MSTNIKEDKNRSKKNKESSFNKKYGKTISYLTELNGRVKDSVFKDIFSNKEYLFRLYRETFPHDRSVSIDDIELCSLKQVLFNGIYNDLAILVKNQLLVFMEAQSSWSDNMPIRMLHYLVHTFMEFERRNNYKNLNASRIIYPLPVFFVVYTGPDHLDIQEVELQDNYVPNVGQVDQKYILNCTTRIFNLNNSSGVVKEYVLFCNILRDMIRKYGFTHQTIIETIRICEDKNILKEYFQSREVEVARILERMFDQEQQFTDFVNGIKRDFDRYESELSEKDALISEKDAQLSDTKKKLYESMKGYVDLCLKLQLSELEIIQGVQNNFGLSNIEASDFVLKYLSDKK